MYVILKDGKLADKCRFFFTIGGARSSVYQRAVRDSWCSVSLTISEAKKRYEVVPVEITVGIIKPIVVENVVIK